MPDRPDIPDEVLETAARVFWDEAYEAMNPDQQAAARSEQLRVFQAAAPALRRQGAEEAVAAIESLKHFGLVRCEDCDHGVACGTETERDPEGNPYPVPVQECCPECDGTGWRNARAERLQAERDQALAKVAEGQQHFPFELILEPATVTNEYFDLCGNCGGIADSDLWQGLDYDEDLDRKVPHLGTSEAGFYRCPHCGYDHTDDDSGPGAYTGTLIGMVEQRKELLGDDDFDWKTRWEEAVGPRPTDADAARHQGAEEERERLRGALGPICDLSPPAGAGWTSNDQVRVEAGHLVNERLIRHLDAPVSSEAGEGE